MKIWVTRKQCKTKLHRAQGCRSPGMAALLWMVERERWKATSFSSQLKILLLVPYVLAESHNIYSGHPIAWKEQHNVILCSCLKWGLADQPEAGWELFASLPRIGFLKFFLLHLLWGGEEARYNHIRGKEKEKYGFGYLSIPHGCSEMEPMKSVDFCILFHIYDSEH